MCAHFCGLTKNISSLLPVSYALSCSTTRKLLLFHASRRIVCLFIFCEGFESVLISRRVLSSGGSLRMIFYSCNPVIIFMRSVASSASAEHFRANPAYSDPSPFSYFMLNATLCVRFFYALACKSMQRFYYVFVMLPHFSKIFAFPQLFRYIACLPCSPGSSLHWFLYCLRLRQVLTVIQVRFAHGNNRLLSSKI